MDKESVQVTSPKAYDQVLEYLKTLIKSKDILMAGRYLRAGTDGNTEDFPKFGPGSTTDPGAYSVLESRHGKGNFLVNRMGESLSSVFLCWF